MLEQSLDVPEMPQLADAFGQAGQEGVQRSGQPTAQVRRPLEELEPGGSGGK
jgi:hypothetical protein